MTSSKEIAQEILSLADIKINGNNPWDIQVHNNELYSRVLRGGSLAFGEAYMDGWWDTKDLDGLLTRLRSADIQKKVGKVRVAKHVLKAWVQNAQTKKRAKKVAQQHYNLGNDVYEAMLDPYMQYTCGYFKGTKSLKIAQEKKLDLICKKLKLKKGMTVLDIGSGFGGLAFWMAKKYDCTVVGYNISEEQVVYARKKCKGLPVTFILDDYRNASGQFDRIVSVGMFEHVGYKNYRSFMKVCDRCLKDDGLILLHTIGGNTSVKTTDPWLEKYIFPGSMLPSMAQIAKATQKLFIIEDWHNFGPYYDITLMHWWANFHKAWPKLRKSYDERFYRMWKYYLHVCAAIFRSRHAQLWQIVMRKHGVRTLYERVS